MSFPFRGVSTCSVISWHDDTQALFEKANRLFGAQANFRISPGGVEKLASASCLSLQVIGVFVFTPTLVQRARAFFRFGARRANDS